MSRTKTTEVMKIFIIFSENVFYGEFRLFSLKMSCSPGGTFCLMKNTSIIVGKEKLNFILIIRKYKKSKKEYKCES